MTDSSDYSYLFFSKEEKKRIDKAVDKLHNYPNSNEEYKKISNIETKYKTPHKSTYICIDNRSTEIRKYIIDTYKTENGNYDIDTYPEIITFSLLQCTSLNSAISYHYEHPYIKIMGRLSEAYYNIILLYNKGTPLKKLSRCARDFITIAREYIVYMQLKSLSYPLKKMIDLHNSGDVFIHKKHEYTHQLLSNMKNIKNILAICTSTNHLYIKKYIPNVILNKINMFIDFLEKFADVVEKKEQIEYDKYTEYIDLTIEDLWSYLHKNVNHMINDYQQWLIDRKIPTYHYDTFIAPIDHLISDLYGLHAPTMTEYIFELLNHVSTITLNNISSCVESGLNVIYKIPSDHAILGNTSDNKNSDTIYLRSIIICACSSMLPVRLSYILSDYSVSVYDRVMMHVEYETNYVRKCKIVEREAEYNLEPSEIILQVFYVYHLATIIPHSDILGALDTQRDVIGML